MNKHTLATLWLDGCSGCHMSFLDMDERLLALADQIELVYGPLVDFKTFPEAVDITLVEGAVSTRDDLEKIQHIRQHTRTLISLGDCAVTANVPSMRNPFGTNTILQAVYLRDDVRAARVPDQGVPPLLPIARPVHAIVKVDVYIPGCPPSPDVIVYALSELLAGRQPQLGQMTRFGK
jgi:NAD-reducing hydrogenase small subunit